jgi:1-acyl-sn-glycerol-3-phosphate acyltransferase
MRFLDDPPRPLFQRCVYDFSRFICRLWLLFYFQLRVHGMQNVPRHDGMLICANHQSVLDPIVIGCAFPRRSNYLAKKTLFGIWWLAWFLKQVDTISIDRDGMGIAGMKETLRRLRRNESVLLFPEGSRTHDGNLQPLMSGFVALAKRVDLPLLPVGLDGPFACWPRGSSFPRMGMVHVVFGKPIEPEEIRGLDDDQITRLLEQRIRVCFDEARQRVRALAGTPVGPNLECGMGNEAKGR